MESCKTLVQKIQHNLLWVCVLWVCECRAYGKYGGLISHASTQTNVAHYLSAPKSSRPRSSWFLGFLIVACVRLSMPVPAAVGDQLGYIYRTHRRFVSLSLSHPRISPFQLPISNTSFTKGPPQPIQHVPLWLPLPRLVRPHLPLNISPCHDLTTQRRHPQRPFQLHRPRPRLGLAHVRVHASPRLLLRPQVGCPCRRCVPPRPVLPLRAVWLRHPRRPLG